MKSRRFFDRRAGFSLASIGLLLGVVTPSLVPAFVSAGQVNSRSIALSNSASSATTVKLNVKGTTSAAGAIASGGGLIIQFCNAATGPVVNTSCTAPTGMAVAASPSTTGSTTAGTATKVSDSVIKWVPTGGLSASTSFDFIVSSITNPSTVGTFYARITTYADSTNLGGYTDETHLGTVADQGAVALSTTSEIGVTAYVQEAMTFCVSGVAPTGNCGTLGTSPVTPTSPSLTLGEAVGSQKALSTTAISTGDVYAQLSTNASHGATVNLQSDATTCGGLYLNNDTANCHITPETTANNGTTGFNAGEAKFGLVIDAASDPDTGSGGPTPTGSFGVATGADYDNTHYFLNYVSGDATGVTSTYGDPILDTGGDPVNNKAVKLTFGASISNTTPAGKYGANLRLIATGTF